MSASFTARAQALIRKRRLFSTFIITGLIGLVALCVFLPWQSSLHPPGTHQISRAVHDGLLARTSVGGSGTPPKPGNENIPPGQGSASSIQHGTGSADQSNYNWFPKHLQGLLDKPDVNHQHISSEEKNKLTWVQKGVEVYHSMLSMDTSRDSIYQDDGSSPQSILESHKWALRGYADFRGVQFLSGLASAMNGLDISREPRDWFSNNAFCSVKVPGSETKTFRADLDNPVNFRQGVLLGNYNFGIEDGMRAEIESGEVTKAEINKEFPLRRWSDVVWLGAEFVKRKKYLPKLPAQTPATRGFEHVFQYHVIESSTKKVLKEVTGIEAEARGGGLRIADLGVWPGKAYNVESDKSYQAMALISAPSIRGVAYMLAQHKKALGSAYTIDRIHIFDCQDPPKAGDTAIPRLCLYMHVKKVSGASAIEH
ncbi:Hypothetical predicted protein [Lecanosticta acicola]|uniref:Uncharacterized protein n=1 Tax=Lecanosticta acicola TaxID=111012 RepID=A0AAI9ED56_9PEZI|nr:Hypothetical predicted protein [Lecanosticta acicola]